jgi:peptidoglycan/LPS O-acetylase OafA/YrhL
VSEGADGAPTMSGQWPDEVGSGSGPAGSPEERRPRWGLRTLGFLGLALLSLVVALTQGHHTFGTLGSLIFGLVGAAYCSVKGFGVARQHDVVRMLKSRDRRR